MIWVEGVSVRATSQGKVKDFLHLLVRLAFTHSHHNLRKQGVRFVFLSSTTAGFDSLRYFRLGFQLIASPHHRTTHKKPTLQVCQLFA